MSTRIALVVDALCWASNFGPSMDAPDDYAYLRTVDGRLFELTKDGFREVKELPMQGPVVNGRLTGEWIVWDWVDPTEALRAGR